MNSVEQNRDYFIETKKRKFEKIEDDTLVDKCKRYKLEQNDKPGFAKKKRFMCESLFKLFILIIRLASL